MNNVASFSDHAGPFAMQTFSGLLVQLNWLVSKEDSNHAGTTLRARNYVKSDLIPVTSDVVLDDSLEAHHPGTRAVLDQKRKVDGRV